jgi:hypothetical protein
MPIFWKQGTKTEYTMHSFPPASFASQVKKRVFLTERGVYGNGTSVRCSWLGSFYIISGASADNIKLYSHVIL